MAESSYRPYQPARRPGRKPNESPNYRIVVHHRFKPHYDELVTRVGLQQAQQFWDHVASTPGQTSAIAQTSFLKGKAGRPQAPGWSRTIHYEVTGSARIDYQYNDEYRTKPAGDAHRVVAILTVNYSSH
jgi:hypothetical protein